MGADAELRLARVRAFLSGWEPRDSGDSFWIGRGTEKEKDVDGIVGDLTCEQAEDIERFIAHIRDLVDGIATATDRGDRFVWGRPGELVSLDSVRGRDKDGAS